MLDGAMVIRLRGFMRMYISASGAILDGFSGASGLCIITENQNVVGITSVMHPVADSDWDGWFWHRFWDLRAITATIADGVNAAAATLEVPIDSKAMRKMKQSDLVVLVHEATEFGAASLRIEMDSRLLVKLA